MYGWNDQLCLHIFLHCSNIYFIYPYLVCTKTVDSTESGLWLASQTPNSLCRLPPSNSGEKWHPGLRKSNCFLFFVFLCGVYIILLLKCYYDQTIISLFSSNFESVFAKHSTGKILSFVFYLKAVYFDCKFWISGSAITHVHNWPIAHQRVGSRQNGIIYSLA